MAVGTRELRAGLPPKRSSLTGGGPASASLSTNIVWRFRGRPPAHEVQVVLQLARPTLVREKGFLFKQGIEAERKTKRMTREKITHKRAASGRACRKQQPNLTCPRPCPRRTERRSWRRSERGRAGEPGSGEILKWEALPARQQSSGFTSTSQIHHAINKDMEEPTAASS